MKIELIDYTIEPLTKIGKATGSTLGKIPNDPVPIARKAINSGHGRCLEFADVTIWLKGASARVMREIYTHIIGTSRLQETTRWIDMSNFCYFIPDSVKEIPEAHKLYVEHFNATKHTYITLCELEVPKEDVANVLPLGVESGMVLKINVRSILHMANERLCKRAYHEYRDFMNLFRLKLKRLSPQWNEIAGMMKPKCEVAGYCIEEKCCGRKPRREEVIGE